MNDDLWTSAELAARAETCYAAGDFAAARAAYERLASAQRAALPAAGAECADTLYWLGVTLLELSEYASAEAVLVEAQALIKADQADLVRCLSARGLARLYRDDAAGAQRLLEEALALAERSVGDEHPETIAALNYLGVIVNRRGERARSLALHKEALARCERTVGDHHRVTAEVCSSLSVRLGAKNPRARLLGERALAIFQRLLGPTHPTTAQVMNNLATLLADAGDDAAARTLLERSLALHEASLGMQHPRLAYVLHNLAAAYQRAAEWDRARYCHERALVIRERTLGAQHAETQQSMHELVLFYSAMQSERGDETVEQFLPPLYICLTALQAATGTLDPDDANMPGAHLAVESAAVQFHDLVGRIEAAHRLPPLDQEQQGTLHHAKVLQTQADQRFKAGDYAAAQTLLEQAIVLIEQVRGPLHLELIAPLRQMQPVMRALHKPTAVLPLVQRIADIHLAVLGEYHPHTHLALSDLASHVYDEYGMEIAYPLFEHNMQLMEQVLGPGDQFVEITHGTIERWRAEYGDAAPAELSAMSRSARHEAAYDEVQPWIEELLHGIDEVDWHSLSHAYGPADDVPQLLRMLASDDEEVREDIWESLYSNIWHQGTVYEASAYAVPFLLRLLADERMPDREGIVYLLQSLATGYSYLAAHHQEWDTTFNWRDILAKQGKDFDEELARELGHVRAANEAVGAGTALFLALAEDGAQSAEMRSVAITTLSVLTGHADAIVPRLLALLDHPDATQFRAEIITALCHQMDDSARSQRFFATLMEGEAEADTGFIAATALIQRTRERAPQAAVEAVLAALRRHGDERGYGYTTYYESVEALLKLGAERARTAMLRALPLLHYTDSDELHRFAETLLDLVFYAGENQHRDRSLSWEKQTKRCTISFYGGKHKGEPERDPATLDEAQREVIAALAAHDPLWQWDSNLLSLYGLPATRDELRRWAL